MTNINPKLIFGSILIAVLLFVIGGCENNQITKEYKGNYINLDENLRKREIVLAIEELDGEIIYSIEDIVGEDINIKYDMDINEGDFKIEIKSNGEILDETQWISVDQEKLKTDYKNKDTILHAVGGTMFVINTDGRLFLVIQGKLATGKIKFTW